MPSRTARRRRIARLRHVHGIGNLTVRRGQDGNWYAAIDSATRDGKPVAASAMRWVAAAAGRAHVARTRARCQHRDVRQFLEPLAVAICLRCGKVLR